MNSRLKPAFRSLWFFLPPVAFRNWQLWDRLPARVGVHFDLAGRPNGWMSRESVFGGVLILMASILGPATLVRSQRFPPPALPRPVLGVFYLALGAIYCGEEWILAYNLDPTRWHVLPIVIGSLGAALALILLFLGTGPSPEFPSLSRLLAEEVYASPWLAWGMLAPAAVRLVIAASVPAGVRMVLILSALVLTGVAVMAWLRFRYPFELSASTCIRFPPGKSSTTRWPAGIRLADMAFAGWESGAPLFGEIRACASIRHKGRSSWGTAIQNG